MSLADASHDEARLTKAIAYNVHRTFLPGSCKIHPLESAGRF
jgi:hypothetical protein